MKYSRQHRAHPSPAPAVRARTLGRVGVTLVAIAGLSVGARLLSAHDFWRVPNAFAVAADGLIEVHGRTSTKFPTSLSAVQADRVADARVIGVSGEERITDLSVGGKSLVLRHRPASPGQRVVAVALVTRTSRAAPAGLKRYIALEGAPELADRYEREGLFARPDSVSQRTTKYAKSVVDVGSGGPRAFARTAGHPLEFVPVTDPSATRAGDALAVRLLFRGRPLANAHLHAGVAAEGATSDSAAAPKDVSLVTDANGIARVALDRAGLWNVRTVHAAPAESGASVWDVHFATIVFRAALGTR